MIHIKMNYIDAFKLKEGDRVKCTYSRIEGRTGKVFTVAKQNVSKKKREEGYAPLWWLSHCDSYGDVFEKLD